MFVLLVLDWCFLIGSGSRPNTLPARSTFADASLAHIDGHFLRKSDVSSSARRSPSCTFQSAADPEETLHKTDALYVSKSGSTFVVDGKKHVDHRFMAFHENDGCHEQCIIRCQTKPGDQACNPDPTPVDSYLNSMLSAFAFFDPKEEVRHIVSAGLGCGGLAHWPLTHIPSATLHAIDINDEVIDAATQFFGVPKSAVVNQDVCQYLREQPDSSIDVLFLDAFAAASTWPQCTLELGFMKQASSKMTPHGLIIANAWPHFSDRVRRSATVAKLYYQMGQAPGLANDIFVISKRPLKRATTGPFNSGDIAAWLLSARFHDV